MVLLVEFDGNIYEFDENILAKNFIVYLYSLIYILS